MHKQHWIAVTGRITQTNGILKAVPKTYAEDDTEKKRTLTEVKSNIDFQGGNVTFEMRIQDPDSRCRLVLYGGKSKDIHVGHFIGSSAYGLALFKDDKWESIKTVGFGTRANINEWIKLRVNVVGSTITLFVNDVKLFEQEETTQRGQIGFYMASACEVEIRNVVVETVIPTAFVVMQFTDDYNALYTDVIKPTFEEFGYKVVRGDDACFNGMIIDDISRAIREASVIIADITPDNPNVFYEVGFAHALDKPTILLSDRKREKLPFDVSGFRTLFYDNTIGGKSNVESRLRQHLIAIAA
jgi:hypothetical protein